MGLIEACSSTFLAFAQFFSCLPIAILLLIRAAVGCSLLFACFKLFIR